MVVRPFGSASALFMLHEQANQKTQTVVDENFLFQDYRFNRKKTFNVKNTPIFIHFIFILSLTIKGDYFMSDHINHIQVKLIKIAHRG